ncbi:MAG: roadblock/LC7 domain-containing protein [Candidatus Thorarchaeota archaeon]|nr:roadblock/LC7 domain-containing protein [Candidatus Thorarchaeota archaeon]
MARKYVDFVLRIRDMSVATMFDMDFEQIQGKIKEIMEDATTTAAGIKAAILLSKEGLPIASALPASLEEAEIAAMAASILGVADLAAERMEQGTLEEVLMTNEKGLVIMRSAGEKAILVLAASKNVKTGLLVYAARTASEKIAPLL